MNTRLIAAFVVLLSALRPLHADDSQLPASIDPLYFLAGVSVLGQEARSVYPPQCESFYKDSGEQRVAEMFLSVTQAGEKTWGNSLNASVYPTRYYYQDSGHRFVVENPGLAEDLRRFYDPTAQAYKANYQHLFDSPEDRGQWLSFMAGVYARCFHDGAFHGHPSPAMRDIVIILLAEGCEVYDLKINQEGVPATMSFKVKPTEKLAQIISAIDHWQPKHAEWKTVE